MKVIEEDLYLDYLQALLSGGKARCYDIVQRLLSADPGIHELYVGLFQRSLYEVGQLWEQNRISVAVEHLATAITENMLSLVYPRIFGAEHNGRSAVVSCIANEYHQIGGRMVADIFEMQGWDGYFLGANTPQTDLFSLLDSKKPDVLALSLSITQNFTILYTSIELLRQRYPELPIMVGGQAFLQGGRDIGERYPGVMLVSSLSGLEQLISGSPELVSVEYFAQGRSL
ncbi:MAG: cobalamin-dependent protein [Spirochaetes bacterium]|nr:cobalamin-dependent protein [Spirochaetota bacterium]MBU0956375.1 cobalamin-dependent protein [Spirochaetota bacterium]